MEWTENERKDVCKPIRREPRRGERRREGGQEEKRRGIGDASLHFKKIL